MAKLVARNAALGVEDSAGACQSITGHSNSITLTWTAEAPEVTSFTDDTRQRLNSGLQDFELTFSAFHDLAANKTDDVLAGILGGATRFVFGPSGSTSTCTHYSGCSILTNYTIEYGVEGAATVSGTLVARAGSLTRKDFD